MVDRPQSILLIEDNDPLRMAYKLKLEQSGYRVHQAHTGRKGEKLFWKKKPDLVLLDIRLPHVNGLDILGQIKDSGWADVPVLMLTNYDGTEREIAKRLGADDYLVKSSCTPETVLQRIRLHLPSVTPPGPSPLLATEPAGA